MINQLPRSDTPVVKKTSLRSSFLWILLGTIVFTGTNWLMQIVLAKLGSPYIVGQYAIAIAISQPTIAFTQFQLRNVLATDSRREYAFGSYLALRLSMVAVAVLVFVLASAFGGYHGETAWIILIFGLGSAFDSMSDLFYGLFQQHERVRYVGLSMSIKGVLSVTGLGGAFALTHNIVWAVAWSSIASAVVVLFYDLPSAITVLKQARMVEGAELHVKTPWAPIWNRVTLIRLAVTAFPLGVTLLLLALGNNISRFYIAKFLGAHDLGIYAALASLIVIGRTAIMSLGQAVNPRLSQYFKGGRISDFRSLMYKFVGGGVLLAVVAPVIAWLWGAKVVSLVFTPEYAHDPAIITLLAAGGGVTYAVSCLGYAITATGYYKVQTGWFGITTVVSALTSWWLVPSAGLYGAGIAALITAAIQLFLGAIIMWVILREAQKPRSARLT